jgi:hypothetical protein
MKPYFLIPCLVMLVACATNGHTASSWPAWVLASDTPGAITAAECVRASGDMGLDRSHAAAAARVTMVRNLETNIQTADELITRKTVTTEQASSAQTFASSAKLLSEKALSNTHVSRVQEVSQGAQKWLCAEVKLEAGDTRNLVKQALSVTNTPASSDVEDLLLEQFRRRAAALEPPSAKP